MPEWVADKQRRAERIRKAKAELEAEAKAAAEAKLKAQAEAQEKREAEGRRKRGAKAAPPCVEPDPKAQKNFADPESRIMKSKDGFVQAYNAQAAVDGEAQINVAQDVTQSATDCGQLVPMTDAIETNLGRKPEQLPADRLLFGGQSRGAGEPRHRCLRGDRPGQGRGCRRGQRPGQRRGYRRDALAAARRPTDARRGHALEDQGRRAARPYRPRKQLPEPVFGQIKQARGFHQFLLRSIERVRAEWATVHNLLKLAQRWRLSAALPMAAGAG